MNGNKAISILLAAAVGILTVLQGCGGDEIEITDKPFGYEEPTPEPEPEPQPEPLTDPGLSWNASSCDLVYGSEYAFPTLDNSHSVTISYSSTNEDVATVASDGTVTVTAAGTTVITASSQETDKYEAGSASYTLNVARAEAGLGWSSEILSMVYGEETVFPVLDHPHGLDILWASSDSSVAVLDSVGTVTILAAGVTTISANSSETDCYESCSVSYDLTVRRAEAGLEWSGESLSMIFGEDADFPVLDNPHGLDILWASSDPGVAVLDSSGTVTILGAGITTISANSSETDCYESCSVSYDLTVQRAEAGLEWSGTEVTTILGQKCSFPTLSNPNKLNINWFSSDESVATIDADGNVTIHSAGVAVISASSSETPGYDAGSVAYTITVGKRESVVSWSAATCSVKIGGNNTFPTLSNPDKQKIEYSSSDGSIASISSDGLVTLHSPGTVTVTAKALESDTHVGRSAFYTLEVGAPDIKLKDPGLAWPVESFSVKLGEDAAYPVLTNPNKLKIGFSSSSKEVATVASNGTVVPVAPGTTTITASSRADDVYLAGSVSYILTVGKASSSIYWSDEEFDVILGSNRSFPTLDNPDGLDIVYSSSNTSVASISEDGAITLAGPGTTTITASSEETSLFEPGSVSYILNVSKKSPSLRWTGGSTTAQINGDNTFPTLHYPPGLSISYSSSNGSVATIDKDGNITLKGAGTTTITASSKETGEYESYSVSYKLKVNKMTPSLSWSESAVTAVLEDGTVQPGLDNPHGLKVTYSSSNTGVATVSTDGTVTLLKRGTTTISAMFAGDDSTNPVTASLTLTVISTTDDGAGIFTYPSTGDPSSDDDISNTTFTRMITITYSGSGEASVEGDFKGYVTVSGNHVTVDNTENDEYIVYRLTGKTSRGSFKLYSEKRQALLLDGVSISNPDGAAINIQSDKRTFVMIDGSNSLSDNSSATYSSGDEDMKAVLFSEGQLVLSGSGSLTVNARNTTDKSGISSDDYVRLMPGPSVKIVSGSSAGHGLRGKDYVRISGGKLQVSTSADMKKGINSDDYVLVEDGEVNITVSGGVGYDSDAKEYKGSAGIKADNYFAMTGGKVTIKNTGNGGKGISAGSYDYDSRNHTLSDSYITGGTLSITTSGYESNDETAKGIKIGYKYGSGRRYVTAGNLVISGGKITVKATSGEGIEAKGDLTFDGGETHVTSNGDDAINCLGEMNVNGGYIYAIASQNDAMDSNCDMKLNGGYVCAINTMQSYEMALDANTEGGYKLYINNGATLVAFGQLERGYSAVQPVYSMTATAGAWNALHDGTSFLAAFKAPSNISTFTVSAPSLSGAYKGVSVDGETFCNGVWATSGISGGTSTSLSQYSGGGGFPGGGGWRP